MLWLSYPDAFVREEALHAKHSFARKFCGCMSLRGGCAIACAIWAVSVKEEKDTVALEQVDNECIACI